MSRSEKNSISKLFVTGTLIAGTVLASGLSQTSGSNLFSFRSLGTAGELRAELTGNAAIPSNAYELTCGAAHAKKTTGKAKSKTVKSESKAKEAKCGAKTDTTKSQSKAKESKCGQGKCSK